MLLERIAAFEYSVVKSTALTTVTNGSMNVLKKVGSKVAIVTLAAVQLSWEAIKNLNLWWEGKLSGKRAFKNFVDASGSIVGGIGGSSAGSIIGAVAFPPCPPDGAFVGGIIGGIGGSIAGGNIFQICTEKFFDLPKTAALAKAYDYLRVHHKDDNSKINTAYRKLALEYHPDKGGSREKWIDLQISLQTIRMARGEAF